MLVWLAMSRGGLSNGKYFASCNIAKGCGGFATRRLLSAATASSWQRPTLFTGKIFSINSRISKLQMPLHSGGGWLAGRAGGEGVRVLRASFLVASEIRN